MSVPAREELSALPLHVVLRDYPETLAVLRRFGVNLPAHGGQPLAAAMEGDPAPLLDALAEVLAWRGQPRPHGSAPAPAP
ncbi:MAG: hypothetical protein HY703_11300 [Gemmatimonadetes bacterium]|nr:hypothetical protein [Gemmatimonadota bacterium]